MTRLAAPLLLLALAACSRSEPPAPDDAPSAPAPPAAAVDKAGVEGGALQSRYTSLKDCKLIESRADEDWSVSRCPGVAPYGLVLNYGDARESLDVVKGGEKLAELKLWLRGGGGFNALGPTVEWRGDGAGDAFAPRFLIVRNVVHRDPDRPERTAEVLEVFDLDQRCIVASIEPQPGQNQAVRAITDGPRQPCLGGPQ